MRRHRDTSRRSRSNSRSRSPAKKSSRKKERRSRSRSRSRSPIVLVKKKERSSSKSKRSRSRSRSPVRDKRRRDRRREKERDSERDGRRSKKKNRRDRSRSYDSLERDKRVKKVIEQMEEDTLIDREASKRVEEEIDAAVVSEIKAIDLKVVEAKAEANHDVAMGEAEGALAKAEGAPEDQDPTLTKAEIKENRIIALVKERVHQEVLKHVELRVDDYMKSEEWLKNLESFRVRETGKLLQWLKLKALQEKVHEKEEKARLAAIARAEEMHQLQLQKERDEAALALKQEEEERQRVQSEMTAAEARLREVEEREQDERLLQEEMKQKAKKEADARNKILGKGGARTKVSFGLSFGKKL